MPDLRHHRAVITGASSGIGAAAARQLAQWGCDLFLVARRTERLAALAAELRMSHGVRAEWLALDLARPESAEKLFQAAYANGTDVDILVNSAGFGEYQYFHLTPWPRHAEMIQVNVTALAELNHRFLQVMRRRTRPSYILNVSSLIEAIPLPFFANYAATKAYIQALTESLAGELRGTKVSVTSLCPSGTRTEFSRIAGQPASKSADAFMMDSDRVAAIGLRAMLRRKRHVVPGTLNRMLSVFTRLLPRGLGSVIAARIQDAPPAPDANTAANPEKEASTTAQRPRRGPLPALPARGTINDRPINTTVDSEIARYYLEHYLRNDRTQPGMDALIDEAERTIRNAPPSPEDLERLSRKFSVDFVSLLLLRSLQQQPDNQRLQERFRRELAATLAEAPMPDYPGYIILFVPGFLYKQDPEVGADFRKPRDAITQLGLPHQLAEIDQIGSVENNAVEIARYITELSHTGKKIVLVGASSAGPAIALALGRQLDAAATSAVRAWVNVGGILRGSPRADEALLWPRRWLSRLICLWKGWDYGIIASYTARVSRARFAGLQLPPHMLIVNFLGIPLSGDVSQRAWHGYLSLRDKGPNDGLTLITDAIAPGSRTIAEPGLDHYFLDPAITAKTVALARTVLGCLESP
ncbi:MAG TPA: SDR family oxidoreductase [Opitutaceae bacterium]|jgi:short-subunit dehydrogenase|nr:SDR family oxidoreductase [Opitutaceae bacterium]